MKIATFNVNSVRSRMPVLENWLKEHQPDYLCLQETKVEDDSFPVEPIQNAGYHAAFRGQKSYNGVAILAKDAPDSVAYGLELDGETVDEPRLVYARYGDLHLVNTYVPQGRELEHEMYAYKLKWLKALREWFDASFSDTDRLLWCGDLNVALEPIDVHAPERKKKHVCYHEDARKALENCKAWGFTDLFRQFHPDDAQYTFFDYRVPNALKRGIGWRIDYIFASPALAKTAANAYIDFEPRKMTKPSDHTVLVAELNG